MGRSLTEIIHSSTVDNQGNDEHVARWVMLINRSLTSLSRAWRLIQDANGVERFTPKSNHPSFQTIQKLQNEYNRFATRLRIFHEDVIVDEREDFREQSRDKVYDAADDLIDVMRYSTLRDTALGREMRTHAEDCPVKTVPYFELQFKWPSKRGEFELMKPPRFRMNVDCEAELNDDPMDFVSDDPMEF
jgi:hypothetical protein